MLQNKTKIRLSSSLRKLSSDTHHVVFGKIVIWNSMELSTRLNNVIYYNLYVSVPSPRATPKSNLIQATSYTVQTEKHYTINVSHKLILFLVSRERSEFTLRMEIQNTISIWTTE